LLGRIHYLGLFFHTTFARDVHAYELMSAVLVAHSQFTAGTFLILRAWGSVRVFAVSIVISVVLGSDDIYPSCCCAADAVLHVPGGMTAVIWTDVVQMILRVRRSDQFLSNSSSNSAAGRMLSRRAAAHNSNFSISFELTLAFRRLAAG